MKKIAIFGCTGSIGQSSLKVVRHLSNLLQVSVLVAHKDIELLESQIKEFTPELVCVFDKEKARELEKKNLPVTIVSGMEGLQEAAAYNNYDLMLMAITGKEALLPTIVAIQNGKKIALASKEVLVSAGEWLSSLAIQKKVPLIPVDSEHNAIFQALQHEKKSDVFRLILTASGGPFRTTPKNELSNVTVEEALKHPSWKMGAKITIDSSTLMNKALEVIEAHYLFGFSTQKINVIIHPQSIIHSMVEYLDGTIIAIMNEPDMVNPIQYALTYPERQPTFKPPFDFTKHSKLEFFPSDFEKFPMLRMAFTVLEEGKSFPCTLNAANDVLVYRFLNKEISWKGISDRLEILLKRHQPIILDSLEKILYVDEIARNEALKI